MQTQKGRIHNHINQRIHDFKEITEKRRIQRHSMEYLNHINWKSNNSQEEIKMEYDN